MTAAPVIPFRLNAMMAMELAIRGAWSILIAGHAKDLGFSGMQIGWIFATFSFGALLSPMVTGWLADRHLPANRLFAACHVLGGITLLGAYLTPGFVGFFAWILAHNLAFYPTLSLANSISFHHLHDRRQYGRVRVWGTMGWIAINWSLSIWLVIGTGARAGDGLLVGAVLSLVGAVASMGLPATPPPAQTELHPVSFMKQLTRPERAPLRRLTIAGVGVGICFAYVYNFSYLYFTSDVGLGLSPGQANAALTLGQLAEIGAMLGLAACLKRFGLTRVLISGMVALWFRLLVFAIGEPIPLVILAQALHGVEYAFFIAAGCIAVDEWLPATQRARGQAFLLISIWGGGMLAGHLSSGWWYDVAHDLTPEAPWRTFFLLPWGILTLTTFFFRLHFRPKNPTTNSRRQPTNDCIP